MGAGWEETPQRRRVLGGGRVPGLSAARVRVFSSLKGRPSTIRDRLVCRSSSPLLIAPGSRRKDGGELAVLSPATGADALDGNTRVHVGVCSHAGKGAHLVLHIHAMIACPRHGSVCAGGSGEQGREGSSPLTGPSILCRRSRRGPGHRHPRWSRGAGVPEPMSRRGAAPGRRHGKTNRSARATPGIEPGTLPDCVFGGADEMYVGILPSTLG